MSKIENLKNINYCNEEFCNKKKEYFIKTKLFNINCFIYFCKDHYNEYVNNLIKFKK